MPIYEYRCPDGHTFEMFQRMSDPPATACEVCGASPVQKVLYPAAIHFKGSGFYSTDYGRGGSSRRDGKDGDSSSEKDSKSDSKPDGKSDSKPSKTETKAAEA